MSVANAFSKARERTRVLTKAKNESCGYFVGVGTEYDDIGRAVRVYCDESAKAKEAAAKAKVVEESIRQFAERIYIERLAHDGIPNPAPLKLVDASGATVVYTVQDRTGSTGLQEETIQQLRDILGPEEVNSSLVHRVVYSFDQSIMSREVSLPGRRRPCTIEKIIGERLQRLTDELVVNGVLKADEAEALIKADGKTTLRKGFMQDLPRFADHMPGLLAKTIEALGAAIVRFIKPA